MKNDDDDDDEPKRVLAPFMFNGQQMYGYVDLECKDRDGEKFKKEVRKKKFKKEVRKKKFKKERVSEKKLKKELSTLRKKHAYSFPQGRRSYGDTNNNKNSKNNGHATSGPYYPKTPALTKMRSHKGYSFARSGKRESVKWSVRREIGRRAPWENDLPSRTACPAILPNNRRYDLYDCQNSSLGGSSRVHLDDDIIERESRAHLYRRNIWKAIRWTDRDYLSLHSRYFESPLHQVVSDEPRRHENNSERRRVNRNRISTAKRTLMALNERANRPKKPKEHPYMHKGASYNPRWEMELPDAQRRKLAGTLMLHPIF